MNYAEAKKMLDKCGQGHVLAWWNKLSKKGQNALLEQVGKIDPKSLAYCQKALKAGTTAIDNSKGKAPKVAVLKGKKLAEAVAIGEKELKAGRVAALLVAGGQGSRLGYDGPKGCYSIGPITGAPLFYFHARKILARTIRYGRTIPFYVMTSEANNEATIRCFEENEYFGLNPKDVFFFTQGMWPGMTQDGKIIMDAPGHVFMSPDGHGGLLAALKRSGALADMKKRGIKSVFFFQVDNPLVEIADPAFIGYHVANKSEYSLKLCAKRDPYEKVGMPMQFGKTFRMVEYTEMTKEQCERRGRDGKLYFLPHGRVHRDDEGAVRAQGQGRQALLPLRLARDPRLRPRVPRARGREAHAAPPRIQEDSVRRREGQGREAVRAERLQVREVHLRRPPERAPRGVPRL